MLAAACTSQCADDPLSGLTVGAQPDPEVPDGWGRVAPGATLLVQGAGGGVATAAIALARAAGLTVWVTSRDEDKRSRALELGAHQAFQTGARLPSRGDAVLETVGKATWSDSMKSLRPGG